MEIKSLRRYLRIGTAAAALLLSGGPALADTCDDIEADRARRATLMSDMLSVGKPFSDATSPAKRREFCLAQHGGGKSSSKPAQAVVPSSSSGSFEDLYDDLLGPYHSGEITQPALIKLIRTNSVDDQHNPDGEIPLDRPVAQRELVTLFFAITIPKGKAAPVMMQWEHDGEVTRSSAYPTEASWRYRLHTAAQFYEPGVHTFVVTMGGREIVRQDITVN